MTDHDILIRECDARDVADLARLRVAFLDELGHDLPDDFTSTLEQWFDQALATPRVKAWAAESAGAIIGTAAINPFERIPNGTNPVGHGWYVMCCRRSVWHWP